MGQMALVRKKLREAFFFYRSLSDRGPTLDPANEDVDFFLSAFLSAGRSITGLLSEKQNRPWFQGWKMGLSEEERRLLNDMAHQRNLEVHAGGADVVPEFCPLPSSEIKAQGSSGTQSIVTSSEAKKYYFWINGKQSDIDGTCRRYVELLLKLVSDFDEHLSAVAHEYLEL